MITLATALCIATASGQIPNWVPAASKITYINNLYSSSRVGIGTLNPQANLHVYDTLAPTLRFTNSVTGTTLQDGALMGYDANRNFFLYNNEAGNSFFGQSYAFQTGTLPFQDTSLYINSAGKVGVGTTSPSEKFQVNRGNVLIKGANNFSSSGDEAVLYLGDNNHYIKSIVGGGLRIGTYGAVNDIAVIENNGNMGLGTTTPSQKLEVGGGNVLIKGTNNFSSSGDEAILYLGDNNHYIKSVLDSGLRIGTYGAPDAIAVFQNNGSVQIPGKLSIRNRQITAGPHTDYTLSVDGKIVAGSLYATASGWADYVFEEHYSPMSLMEKEQFFRENKHLPGVASGKQIMDEGVNLAETLKGLTQNVEENSLEIIELYRMIQQLQQENKTLRQQLSRLTDAH